MAALNSLAIFRRNNFPGRPTIIFLHDSLGCIKLWRDFPERLGELTRCNVLVYDRQGYGQSPPLPDQKRNNYYMEKEADILINLLEEWKIEKPILFGHSDGGSIALIAAGKYPGKIKAIISEGAHIFVEDITLEGIKEATRLYDTTDLKTRLEKYHGDKTEQMFLAWTETWNSPAFRSWNIEHFIRSIECPSLIIQGEEDEYGTFCQVDGIVNNTKGKAEKIMLPNIKHTPHKEDPELLLTLSAKFIDQVLSDQF